MDYRNTYVFQTSLMNFQDWERPVHNFYIFQEAERQQDEPIKYYNNGGHFVHVTNSEFL